MRLLTEQDIVDYLAQPRERKEDGGVVGLTHRGDGNEGQVPYVVNYAGDTDGTYVSGDTIEEWGVHDLHGEELDRCGFTEREVEVATEYRRANGHNIGLAELEAEVAAHAPRP